MKILIVGGGIGGLTSALCCHHFGHEVTVFEQAKTILDIGAGIQIPPNAMKVFEALGIDNDIAKNAFRPEAVEARMGESGRNIFEIPLAEYAIKKWGSPYLHIHRSDYVDALAGSLEKRQPGAVFLGAQVKGYRQDEASITLTLADGREFTGDVLIGADGIKSTVRAQMLGPDTPNFTGNMAWRAVVPIDRLGLNAPKPTACVWMGKGRHAVTYRLRGGKLANFVGVVERQDWLGEGWIQKGSRDDALKDFAGWNPVVTNIIENAAEDRLYRWALFDREPFKRWTDKRAVLLGDAAHPMLPFLAQGAAMAAEDAWVLAKEISQEGRPVKDSLKQYQSIRLVRTSQVQSRSRANMKTFHQRSRFGQLTTYGPMWLAAKLFPAIVHNRMNWLYGYNACSKRL